MSELSEKISEHKQGWLSPKLEFFPVKLYTHLQSALELPLGETLRATLNEAMRRAVNHSMSDDAMAIANAQIKVQMLRAGWMRVAIIFGDIVIEGSPEAILAKAQTIQAKIECLGMKIVWNVQPNL